MCAEFAEGNAGLTQTIVSSLTGWPDPADCMTSSTQAALDNPYGRSKKAAEDILFEYGAGQRAQRSTSTADQRVRQMVAAELQFGGLHFLPQHRPRPARSRFPTRPTSWNWSISMTSSLSSSLFLPEKRGVCTCFVGVGPTYRITLGELAEQIYRLPGHSCRPLLIPDLSDGLTRKLHATYLSYLEPTDFSYPLEIKPDNRGELAELIKSAAIRADVRFPHPWRDHARQPLP